MGTKTILLIDDESLVLEELGDLLRDEGYRVITAQDGDEGIDRFREHRPEMVITDVRMPRRDGLAVVKLLRAEAPAVPITIITGHGTEAMAIEALRAGVSDFLKKPVRLEDLLAAIERMEAALRLAQRRPAAMPASVRTLEHTWTYRLGNDRESVPAFVDALLQRCAPTLDTRTTAEVSLALRELILNAIEHGNLGLSYEDKAEALENGTLAQVIEARRTDPALRDRVVTVTARMSQDQLSIRIADQGQGFNWRSLPDPTDPANVLSMHGRGVMLARLSVDDLVFNDAGNEVTLLKKIRRRA